MPRYRVFANSMVMSAPSNRIGSYLKLCLQERDWSSTQKSFVETSTTCMDIWRFQSRHSALSLQLCIRQAVCSKSTKVDAVRSILPKRRDLCGNGAMSCRARRSPCEVSVSFCSLQICQLIFCSSKKSLFLSIHDSFGPQNFFRIIRLAAPPPSPIVERDLGPYVRTPHFPSLPQSLSFRPVHE
jgi:hypothetical protein